MPNVYGSLWTLNESLRYTEQQVEESEQFTNNGLPTWRVTLCTQYFRLNFPLKKEGGKSHNEIQS